MRELLFQGLPVVNRRMVGAKEDARVIKVVQELITILHFRCRVNSRVIALGRSTGSSVIVGAPRISHETNVIQLLAVVVG